MGFALCLGWLAPFPEVHGCDLACFALLKGLGFDDESESSRKGDLEVCFFAAANGFAWLDSEAPCLKGLLAGEAAVALVFANGLKGA